MQKDFNRRRCVVAGQTEYDEREKEREIKAEGMDDSRGENEKSFKRRDVLKDALKMAGGGEARGAACSLL